MRKVFRVIYLLIMPVLFLALLAICLSFEGTITMGTTASITGTITDAAVGVKADCLVNLKGTIFEVSNWCATLSKQFKLAAEGLTLIFKDVTSGDPIALEEGASLTLQMLSIIGIAVFGIGFFLSEVGYGSKVVTILGAIILIGGSVCIYLDTGLNEGLRYALSVHTVQNDEEIVHEVINFKLDWLNLKLVAGVADGLTILNVIFVLFRRKKA